MRSLRFLAAFGLLSVAAFLVGVAADLYWLRMATKPWPVLALAVLVWSRGRRPYAGWIAAGFLFSVAGDILLEASPGTFLAGVGAFLLAHVAYVVAFLGENRAPRWLRALPFAAWGVGLLAWLWPGLGAVGMRVPVAVYTTVICTMLWRAAARLGDASRGNRLAFAGALIFAGSDSLIALDRFGDVALPGVRYAIILLYWLGQALIAASSLPLAGDEAAP